MVKHKRGMAGAPPAATAGTSKSSGRDNAKHAAFWASHRSGPFLVHKVGGCEPQPIDNAGFLDNFDTAIDQGFMICPKCMKAGGQK